jgi:hypothetical protein
MEDKPSYASTWALIRNLWDTWEPNDTISSLCLQRWGQLHQDILQECVRLHKMEASGQYREPKVHRIMDLYAERTTKEYTHTRTMEAIVDRGPSQAELDDWDKWAEDVLADVTDDEIRRASERLTFIGKLNNKRILAVAVDFVRSNP